MIGRPLNTFPLLSFRIAEAWAVWPTSSEAVERLTRMLATGVGAGAFTVIEAFALTPSIVPRIVAVPGAMALT